MKLPFWIPAFLGLAACNTVGSGAIPKAIPEGVPRKINTYYSLNQDCTADPGILGRVVVASENGRVSFRPGADYPSYPRTNSRYRCNLKKAPSVQLWYTPNPGFRGSDSTIVEALYPDGTMIKRTFTIDVR